MDVAVESAGGEDLALARDHVGAGTDDDGDARLDVGIAGLADRADHAFLDRDVGLDDAPMIDDQRVGDHGVDRALLVGHLRLAHAVANDLAAAELHLLAIDGEILLDLDDEIGVGQPHPVAGGRPEHVGIDGTFDFGAHKVLLAMRNRLVEFRIEPGVAATATRDDLLGPVGVIDQIVALLLSRIAMNARTDIADLVGDLDQLRAGRFVGRIDRPAVGGVRSWAATCRRCIRPPARRRDRRTFRASSSRVVSVSSMVSCSQPAATSSASAPSVTDDSRFATSAR